ncbi:MAG TPA: hypothetical protein VFU14_11885 [Acidimicrobiales bacterium]|nr:hypothetical protein [Acidimicrobiales bacterium]
MRSIALPDGRHLVVRAPTREDVPAICALYERLGPTDRHRRFFSGFHPDGEFVTHLVERDPALGAMLVVEVGDGEQAEIVAEAEYGLLEDGDGELGITVDRRWRGWLAPYLLDALLEVAASRGVPNLRAEVLVENRPMLAMVRARGYAALDTDDRCVLDAVISTQGPVPSWPAVRRGPRVVVEVPGAHWRLGPALREVGVDVLGCPGPRGRPDDCPLVRGEGCPLAEGADLVVHALGADDPGALAVLDAHRRAGTRHLVVDVRRGHHAHSLPAGAVEIEDPTPEEVQALVRSLLDLPDVGGRGSAQEVRAAR